MPKTKFSRLSRFNRFNKLNKLKIPKSRGSRTRLGLFVSTFALIGVYLVFASFAAYISSSAEAVQYNDINATRAQNGRASVAYNGCLSNMARAWAQQMAANRGTGHNPNLQAQMNNCLGSSLRYGGENVGLAFRGPTPCNDTDQNCSQAIYNGFLASPDHFSILVDPGFSTVGIGAYRDDSNSMWVVLDFAGCAGTCPGNTTPPTNTYSPPPPPAKVTISGQVTFGSKGWGGTQLYVYVPGNDSSFPVTDGNGNWSAQVPVNMAYAVRLNGGNHPATTYQASNGTPSFEGQTTTSNRGGYNFNFAEYRSLSLTSNGVGYSLDSWGGVHPVNGAPGSNISAYWGGWSIARALTLDQRGNAQGYVMDGWGGIHPFNSAPALSGFAYWPNWDIARDIKFANWTNHWGYTLDGWGGIHPMNSAPAAHWSAYWNNWDIARKFIINNAGTGGYVLDGWGGVHPFSIGSNSMPPNVNLSAYWNGWDIARSIVINPAGNAGYVMDGWGGIHAFAASGVAMPPRLTSAYWNGWDIARDMVITNWSNYTGYLLDGYGGVHYVHP